MEGAKIELDSVLAGSLSADGDRVEIDFQGPDGQTSITLPSGQLYSVVNLALRLYAASAQHRGSDPSLPVVSCAIGANPDGPVTLTFGLDDDAEITVVVHPDSAKDIADTITDAMDRRALAAKLRANLL